MNIFTLILFLIPETQRKLRLNFLFTFLPVKDLSTKQNIVMIEIFLSLFLFYPRLVLLLRQEHLPLPHEKLVLVEVLQGVVPFQPVPSQKLDNQ